MIQKSYKSGHQISFPNFIMGMCLTFMDIGNCPRLMDVKSIMYHVAICLTIIEFSCPLLWPITIEGNDNKFYQKQTPYQQINEHAPLAHAVLGPQNPRSII